MENKDQAQEKIWDLDFETAWAMCKAHNEFKGMSKAEIKRSRSGYPYMKLGDLYLAGKLTQEEKSTIGIK